MSKPMSEEGSCPSMSVMVDVKSCGTAKFASDRNPSFVRRYGLEFLCWDRDNSMISKFFVGKECIPSQGCLLVAQDPECQYWWVPSCKVRGVQNLFVVFDVECCIDVCV